MHIREAVHHDSSKLAVKIAGSKTQDAAARRPPWTGFSPGPTPDDRYRLLAIFLFRIWAYQVSISACGWLRYSATASVIPSSPARTRGRKVRVNSVRWGRAVS